MWFNFLLMFLVFIFMFIMELVGIGERKIGNMLNKLFG